MPRNSARPRHRPSGPRRAIGVAAIASIAALSCFGNAAATAAPLPLEPYTPPAQATGSSDEFTEELDLFLMLGSSGLRGSLNDPVGSAAGSADMGLCLLIGYASGEAYKCFGSGYM
ncbi:hypothetical protein [Nocardia sp.]|uniref:hypothetical protein n=1 Tax=Nocardia sp. TaxID=1821 RepID=UPI002B4B2502|nr:hypothetical protein [Nocardia sp.]